MKAVKFIRDYDPYESGEVVDLDDKLADKLVKDEVCKTYSSGLRSLSVSTSKGGANV